MLFALSALVLGIQVHAFLSDQVTANLTVTIPPGEKLREYFCNESFVLPPNITFLLEAGEHQIFSRSFCSVIGESIRIIGSNVGKTTVRCDGEETKLKFTLVQNFTMEKTIFVNCGIQLVSTVYTLVIDCTFQSNSNGAISSESSINTSITNCVFQNNRANNGAAILVNGSAGYVSIANCTLQDNSATERGGAIYLANLTGSVDITNCIFYSNSARMSGGAVYIDVLAADFVSITNCAFESNSADHGGALRLYGSRYIVMIANSTFQNNSATSYGGAINKSGSTSDSGVDVSITICTFVNNSAANGGGAVYLGTFTGNVAISVCTFHNNRAAGYGGAIELYESTADIDVSITICTFVNNSAANGGGAVYLGTLTGNVAISVCTFHNNRAAGYGGAIDLYESTADIDVSITICTFVNNSAANGGGAVYLGTFTGNVAISVCTFHNNRAAGYGGAIDLYESTADIDVSITICTFVNNSAANGGGAVYLGTLTGNVAISVCTFHNNRAADYGGAIDLYESTADIDVSITICTFVNNSAAIDGGALYLINLTGNVAISNCTFHSNNAIHYGGAILFYESTADIDVRITICTFVNNSAANGGGAVYLGTFTGNVAISVCTFHNNRAADYGGAIDLYESTADIDVSITICTFVNNSAVNGGGAVYLGTFTGNVAISVCTFHNNRAAGYGGAIDLYESTADIDVSITICTFVNNSAVNGGGAVYLGTFTGNVAISVCTFHNNRAAGYGGAIELYESTVDIDVSITICTFVNNSAAMDGGAVYLGTLTGNVAISVCTFHNNSAAGDGGAIELYAFTGHGSVSITFCTFYNNAATKDGGAMNLENLRGSSVNFTNCIFWYNSAAISGGAIQLLESTTNVGIMNCIFYYNSAAISGGAVFHYNKESKHFVRITNSTFESNSADHHGGALELYVSEDTDIITHSTFQMNRANISGGAIFAKGKFHITICTFLSNKATYGGALQLYGSVNITNGTFQENSALFGGAIFTVSNDIIFIIKSNYINNTAFRGAAAYVSNKVQMESSVQIYDFILEDVVVKDNYCICNEYNKTRGGAIYFSGLTVKIYGITGSQFSSNSPQGAIQGVNGYLHLHGKITFTDNKGENGGAISLSNNVPVYFNQDCSVEFSRNVATRFGGGIYNEGDQTTLQPKESEVDNVTVFIISNPNCVFNFMGDNISITFIHNHAQQGGHAVYATPIYHCDQSDSNMGYLNNHFIIQPLPEDRSEPQVLSFPSYVQFCDCNDQNVCIISTYPGRAVKLHVTSVDYGYNTSPSVIYAQYDRSLNISLGPFQDVQWVQKNCSTLEYQIYGPENASFQLLLSNYPGNVPAVIEVKLLPCEPGLILVTDPSTGLMKCDCSLFLESLGVVCNASDGSVARQGINWIGLYHNTLPAVASTCPLDYCNSTINKLFLSRPDSGLCSNGRTGILCGHCHDGDSVILGSSRCQMCPDVWLITLVMFAVLGALLVAALFFLNLTVTQGTLYGLIFYANIIQVNSTIYFSRKKLQSLQVIVSFINLDLGIPMCLYNGMDDADKAGLQFVFPAYLLVLTITIIVVCHYCLHRSPNDSNSCVYRFPIMIGERAVGVLSTLIYLSYSKFLRAVIDVLTYSTLHLPSGDMHVWFYDGNIQYLHGKHNALFAVAMGTGILFLLPYTFVLTFIPIVEHYSEHNRLINYLHKKVNRIKPMNDAHYAPYKGEWQWWLGARLWLLVVMYILNPVYSSDNPSLLLSIQATMLILFMLLQAGIKPFGQSLQKNEHMNFYNQLYNCLDLFYLLNYTVLALSMSYILDHGSDQTHITLSVGILVGLFVVVLMVTFLYHLIVATLKAGNMYDIVREKINGIFKQPRRTPLSIELNEPINNSVSTTIVTVGSNVSDLREPLMEEFTSDEPTCNTPLLTDM